MFLGFEETVGDGKNLSLQDIRFARTINRIQKNMISELNKIAIIHLFIFGTAKNYSGNKQVLSTGLQFYFGIRPGKSAFDRLIKYYGPKGVFPPAE